jgi:N-acetylneuraminic acid mutarotase
MQTRRGNTGSIFSLASLLAALPLFGWAQPGWLRTTDYPLSGHQFDPVEAGGQIYVAGGSADGSSGNSFSNVFFAAAKADGSLGAWAAATPLPEADAGSGVAVYNGWVYVALGSGNIYRAPILAGGGLGTWTAEAPVETATSYTTALRAYNGYLYLFGRYDGVYHNVTRLAAINADGSLGPWVLNAVPVPLPLAREAIQFYNNRVYLAGGISTGNSVKSFSYSALVRTNGALVGWRQEANLPVPLWQHTSVITNDQIFLFGGLTNNAPDSQINTIYQGAINPADGTISTWTAVDTTPSAFNTGLGAVYVPANQSVYLIGGLDAVANASTAQVWRKTSGAVVPTNHPPVAQVMVSPLAHFPGVTGLMTIAPDNQKAAVVLDGSQSSDADNDPLQYVWQEGANIIASNAVAATVLTTGSHDIALTVSDGKDTGTAAIALDVITPAQAVGLVQDLVIASFTGPTQPLLASLRAAAASFDGGDTIPGVNQLQAFQHKVQAQVAPLNPALAQALNDAAQQIIEAVTGT